VARPIRIEYPGAAYHVMARGNRGERIFHDDADRHRFLETLGEACEKTGWRIHAYVLMANHYHLLLETPEANLVAGMKWLQGAYTQRYNRRHRVFGHLFQGRYKAVVVDAQEASYFQVVSTYIHLNPARAGLIEVGRERLKRYRWSSYPWYLNRAGKRPTWLSTERVLGSLHLGAKDRQGYEAYLEGRVLELASKAGRKEMDQQWKSLRRGWYLGQESFAAKLERTVADVRAGKRRESHSGPAKRAHDQSAAEQQLKRGLAALGLESPALAALPKGAPEKLALAWWIRRRTTVPLRWVSERLAMGHYSRVTHDLSQATRKPNPKIQRLRNKLLRIAEEE
jgi:putative transposase